MCAYSKVPWPGCDLLGMEKTVVYIYLHLALIRWDIFAWTMENKFNVLVSSFRFIWIPTLWVYCPIICFISINAGTVIRWQIIDLLRGLDRCIGVWKWNESGFRPPLFTYRLNWARRTSRGWWDDWDDTVLQTHNSKFESWRSQAEHAPSRSRRLPTILTFTRGWRRNIFVSFKPPRPGTEPRTLMCNAAVLTTTLGVWKHKLIRKSQDRHNIIIIILRQKKTLRTINLAPVAETGFSHRLTAYKIVGHFFGLSYRNISGSNQVNIFFRISNISVPCPHAQLRGGTVIKNLWTFFGPWGRDLSQSPPCWIFRVKQIHPSTASERTTRQPFIHLFTVLKYLKTALENEYAWSLSGYVIFSTARFGSASQQALT